MMKTLTLFFLIILISLASGCGRLYNKNGWSAWGWSQERINNETHIGFISTDFFFENASRPFQEKKEGIKFEDSLKEELGFGTVGVYQVQKF